MRIAGLQETSLFPWCCQKWWNPHLWSTTVHSRNTASEQHPAVGKHGQNRLLSLGGTGKFWKTEFLSNQRILCLTLLFSISGCFCVFSFALQLGSTIMLIYLSFGHQDPLVKEGRKNSADQSFLEWFALRLVRKDRQDQNNIQVCKCVTWCLRFWIEIKLKLVSSGAFHQTLPIYERAQSRWSSKNYEFALEEKKGANIPARIQVLSKASILHHNPRKRLGTAWPRSDNCCVLLVFWPTRRPPALIILAYLSSTRGTGLRKELHQLSVSSSSSFQRSIRTTGRHSCWHSAYGAYTESIS